MVVLVYRRRIKLWLTSGQLGMQPGMIMFPMTVNSSMPSIPKVMTPNKPGDQNVMTTSQDMSTSQQPTSIRSVPILMRPDTSNVSAEKPVATVPTRVIGTPQVVGARPAEPGKPSDNPKEKCRNFLASVLDLSTKEPNSVEKNVRSAIQELIDAQIEPEEFCGRLDRLINASPRPFLIGFLKKSLPLLRQSLVKKELFIEGIKPPSPRVAVSDIPSPTPPIIATPNLQMKPSDNPKEKCRIFLSTLLALSTKESNSVERNVRSAIQELIDAQIEPEEFCDRLERLVNGSPQPCLIGFLKKSLPLLRQSLVKKEFFIEGITPPSPHVAVSDIPSPTPPTIATPNVQTESETSSQHFQSANADLNVMSPPAPPTPPATQTKEDQSSSSSEYFPRRKKVRKSDELVDVVEVLNRVQNISSINVRNEKDEFHFFGLNVASQLRQLPLYEALGVQTEIQAILTSARRRNMCPNLSAHINSTSASNTQNGADAGNVQAQQNHVHTDLLTEAWNLS